MRHLLLINCLTELFGGNTVDNDGLAVLDLDDIFRDGQHGSALVGVIGSDALKAIQLVQLLVDGSGIIRANGLDIDKIRVKPESRCIC